MAQTFTIEEIGARARQRNPEGFGQFGDAEIGQRLVERNPKLQRLIKKDSFLASAAKGIARPFAEFGTSVVNVAESIADISRGDVAGAQEALQKTRQVPLLGETKPVVTGAETPLEAAKAVTGSAAQIASTVVGGGGGVGVVRAGLGGAIKAGARQGVVTGAAAGGLEAFGGGLREDKSFTDIIKQTGVGVVGGGLIGGAIGGAGGLLGAGVRRAGAIRRPQSAIDSAVSGATRRTGLGRDVLTAVGEKARGVSEKLKGSPARLKINTAAQKAAREEFQALPGQTQRAVQKGILVRDANLIQNATAGERDAFRRLVTSAEDFSANRLASPPSKIVGEEFSKRLNTLKGEVSKVGKDLEVAIAPFGNQPMTGVADDIIFRMQEIRGLKGIKLTGGRLDFIDTALSTSLTKAERKVLQSSFSDTLKRNATQGHRLRQEFFEELGGRTRAGVKTTDTAQAGLNAIRQGIADNLERISDTYKTANQEMAELLGLQKRIRGIFGEVKEGAEDVFDVKSSILLRRLTSNAKSGQDMAELIAEVEDILLKRNIDFDTSIQVLQEFVNLLNRHYDIAGDTSLLGILRSQDVPTNAKGLLGNLINTVTDTAGATPDTAREAIKDLLAEAI